MSSPSVMRSSLFSSLAAPGLLSFLQRQSCLPLPLGIEEGHLYSADREIEDVHQIMVCKNLNPFLCQFTADREPLFNLMKPYLAFLLDHLDQQVKLSLNELRL